MSAFLTLNGLAVSDKGPAVSARIGPRTAVAIFGPSGAGKTRFIRVLAGLEKPSRGTIERHGHVAFCELIGSDKKSTPQSIAKASSGGGGANRSVEVLTALGLWESRKEPCASLFAGQGKACEMIAPLCAAADVILFDEHLDRLDPWSFSSCLSLLEKRVARGAAYIVATNRPELAPICDLVIVLNDKAVAFCGSYQELERVAGPKELLIETRACQGGRALADPLGLIITETDRGISVRTGDENTLAARLLLEGYGDVSAVVTRKPTPRELIERVIGRA